MGVPSPAIPSFTDGTVVHQADLNALAANLTNLYAYNQGAFQTQRPAVVASQTSAQTLPNGGAGTLLTFQSAPINVGNMWVASQPQQITIQTAGMYFVFGALCVPNISSPTFTDIARADLLLNGTTPGSNSVMTVDVSMQGSGIGATPTAFFMSNVASGSTFFLAGLQLSSGSLATRINHGSSFLAAFYIGSST